MRIHFEPLPVEGAEAEQPPMRGAANVLFVDVEVATCTSLAVTVVQTTQNKHGSTGISGIPGNSEVETSRTWIRGPSGCARAHTSEFRVPSYISN